MAGLRSPMPLSNCLLSRTKCEALAMPQAQVLAMRRGVRERDVVVRAVAEVAELRKQILEQEVDWKNFRIQEVDTAAPADWHSGTVRRVEEVVPGVKSITLETECSREFISRGNAYLKHGQLAQVRIGEEVFKVPASSPPFPKETNDPVLYKIRGDIPAGTTKVPQFSLSVIAPFDLYVSESSASKLYNVKEGDEVAVGPFLQTGLDLRPVLFIHRFSTVLIFAQGNGIAVARALIETQEENVGSLSLGLRRQTRLFYSAASPSLVAYKDKFEEWEARKVDVRTTVDRDAGEAWDGIVGPLSTLWDEDDIEYDPETTSAIVCVDKGQREALKALLEEAGIPEQQTSFWEA